MRPLRNKWPGRLLCYVLLAHVGLRWHARILLLIIKLAVLLFLLIQCLRPQRFIAKFILADAQLRYTLSNLKFNAAKRLVRGVSFRFEDASRGQSRTLTESCRHVERQLANPSPEFPFDMSLRCLLYVSARFNGGRKSMNDEEKNDNNCVV